MIVSGVGGGEVGEGGVNINIDNFDLKVARDGE